MRYRSNLLLETHLILVEKLGYGDPAALRGPLIEMRVEFVSQNFGTHFAGALCFERTFLKAIRRNGSRNKLSHIVLLGFARIDRVFKT